MYSYAVASSALTSLIRLEWDQQWRPPGNCKWAKPFYTYGPRPSHSHSGCKVCGRCNYGRIISQIYRFTDADARRASCKLGKSKTKAMVISFGKTPELQPLKLDNCEIERVNTIKLPWLPGINLRPSRARSPWTSYFIK